MREYIAIGTSVAGGVLALIAVTEVPPGGQISIDRILSVLGCLVLLGLARFWPVRNHAHSDARKVRR